MGMFSMAVLSENYPHGALPKLRRSHGICGAIHQKKAVGTGRGT